MPRTSPADGRALPRARAVWDIPFAVFVSTQDGRLIDANDAYLKMFGYESVEAARGFDETGLWPSPEHRKRMISELRLRGEVEGLQVTLVRLDGSEFPAKVWVRMVPETGELRGAVEDVTAGRAARIAIEESRNRFRALFELSPAPTQIQDLRPTLAALDTLRSQGVDDLIAYFETHPEEALRISGSEVVVGSNPAMVALTGVAHPGALSGPVSERTALAQTEEGAVEWMRAFISTPEGGSCHTPMMRAGHPAVFQLNWAVPQSDGVPDFSRVVVTFTDITQVEKARQVAEEVSELKSRLIASVSHELRTPLSAIVGYAQLLEAESARFHPEHAGMVSTIASTSLQMAGIIEDLLASARADLGDLAIAPRSIRLDIEAKEALPTVDVEDEEVTILGAEVTAWGDPGRVRQVVRNLIANAVRHGAGPIRVETAGLGSRAVLRVRDAGPGVPPESEDRIFEPYWTAAKSPGHTESMGLGLSLSRKLARRMGGDLVYRRENDETVFELILPMNPPTEFDGDVVSPASDHKPGSEDHKGDPGEAAGVEKVDISEPAEMVDQRGQDQRGPGEEGEAGPKA